MTLSLTASAREEALRDAKEHHQAYHIEEGTDGKGQEGYSWVHMHTHGEDALEHRGHDDPCFEFQSEPPRNKNINHV